MTLRLPLQIVVIVVYVAFCYWYNQSHAGELRAEAGFGRCQYSLAIDTSWHYDYGGEYETDMHLGPRCEQFGVLWLPRNWLGARAAYVDLGTITANNTFPLDEPAYMAAKDNHTAAPKDKGWFVGSGGARGLTLGPVVETPWEVHLQAEAGVAYLYNTWHAQILIPQVSGTWAYADGWNTTWYVGAGVRYGWLAINWRRYANVHASQADKNYQYIGPTSGHLTQLTVGLSVPFR